MHRLPTHLKIISGTAQPERLNKNEPKPEMGIPKPPAHLTAYARAYWKHIAPMIFRTGVLALQDASALESLCECYSDLRTARTELKAYGSTTYQHTTGSIREYPQVKQVADADRRMKAWLGEFGLTPASRSRTSATPTGPTAGAFDKFKK